jgi:hypothetical protein
MTKKSKVETEADAVPEEKIIIGDRYHRRRPFLVVTSVRRPAKGQRTEQKGAQLQRFETPSVVDSVSNTHLREAEVIIDIMNRVAVKNRFLEVADDEKIAETYLAKYAEIVTEGLSKWARKRGMAEGL